MIVVLAWYSGSCAFGVVVVLLLDALFDFGFAKRVNTI